MLLFSEETVLLENTQSDPKVDEASFVLPSFLSVTFGRSSCVEEGIEGTTTRNHCHHDVCRSKTLKVHVLYLIFRGLWESNCG